MDDLEKLRVLIPHWIEHNGEHAGEYREWASRAGAAGSEILEAARVVERANESLQAALDKLGGPLEAPHSHEHHHHG
jgi:hypothetical protein